MSKCDHCGACLDACFEPHVIEFIKPKYDKGRKEKGVDKQLVINGDCTLCGRCFDVCHTDSYSYTFRLPRFSLMATVVTVDGAYKSFRVLDQMGPNIE